MNQMQTAMNQLAAGADIDVHSGAAVDSEKVGAVCRDLDHFAGGEYARVTLGFSPASNLLALLDWSLHWAGSPGKRVEVALEMYLDLVRLGGFSARALLDEDTPDLIEPDRDDHRFQQHNWRHWPFRVYSQGYLLAEKWWAHTTRDVLGVDKHHSHIVSFAARQWLDVWSPTNHPLTNPEVLQKTWESGGTNFLRGLGNLAQDVTRNIAGKPPVGFDVFEPGKNVAITPGQVIYRNRLMELIQYTPATDTVYAEPILIVPAWIMKYYILDLTPEHSLIRYLVAQGHTVFCMSWHNVGADDRDIGFDDYCQQGVKTALAQIAQVLPEQRVHGVGYYLGGTLLTAAAAAMARDHDDQLASVTLFAAQTDFTEPGELGLFIDASQIGVLESMMWAHGVLTSGQMAGAFQILQSNDLVWSRLIRDYLMGERGKVTDLMAWNADGTRMPYRMHSEYLRTLFLDNDLAAGRLEIGGHAVAVQNIRVPIFAVGTETDRIAPWRSVFKIHHLADTDVTFALTNGGHNAGIVAGPENSHRHYRLQTMLETQPDPTPDEWLQSTQVVPGSWWPAWLAWLQQHSSAQVPAPLPAIDPDLPAAPGSYIFEQ